MKKIIPGMIVQVIRPYAITLERALTGLGFRSYDISGTVTVNDICLVVAVIAVSDLVNMCLILNMNSIQLGWAYTYHFTPVFDDDENVEQNLNDSLLKGRNIK